MLGQEEVQPEGITVEDFASAHELGLNFEILHGGKALTKSIRSPRTQKLGLALAGYVDYLHAGRVLLFGGSEINYLAILDPAARERSIRSLFPLEICCIVITRGLESPVGLTELAAERGFALLRTGAQSSVAIRKISEFLEIALAPRTTIHGVFVEVLGLGILILGPSGIGKSECALELILRGHRLIADDSVEVMRRGSDRLIGAGGPILKHHMELRGIGIVDIKELFGISATGELHVVDLAIRLERWKPDAQYDRLGFDRPTMEILGIEIPVIDMPVAPGRNVSTLVEVAARTHLLRKNGRQLSKELSTGQ
jgi:HPr kinase/phosphorylase